MSLSAEILPPPVRNTPLVSDVDDRRGTMGILLFITTEAFLFIFLFTAYFYLAQGGWRWQDESGPKIPLAFVMLGILVTSSIVLQWGEKQVKSGRHGVGRLAVGITILLGLCFLAIQGYEYFDALKSLTPDQNVYGSIFYTITSFHAAHVIVGLFMLTWLFVVPRYEPSPRLPHRPYHNVTLYWHFVDFIWLWIVAFLYVAPNIR